MSLETDITIIKRLIETNEPVFKAATPEQQAKRKEELLSRPMYKYGQDLLWMVRKNFRNLIIFSEINEEGDFVIEGRVIGEPHKKVTGPIWQEENGVRKPIRYVPFAIWLHTDGMLMILTDVYSYKEGILCSYDDFNWPPKENIIDRLKNFMSTQEYK
jgi:hypothetical protein